MSDKLRRDATEGVSLGLHAGELRFDSMAARAAGAVYTFAEPAGPYRPAMDVSLVRTADTVEWRARMALDLMRARNAA